MSVLVVALNGFLTEPTEMLPDTRNPKFSAERLAEEERIASSFLASWNLVILPRDSPRPGPSLYVAGFSFARNHIG